MYPIIFRSSKLIFSKFKLIWFNLVLKMLLAKFYLIPQAKTKDGTMYIYVILSLPLWDSEVVSDKPTHKFYLTRLLLLVFNKQVLNFLFQKFRFLFPFKILNFELITIFIDQDNLISSIWSTFLDQLIKYEY